MRAGTADEAIKAIAKADWPLPRYMITKRVTDTVYERGGDTVAHRTQVRNRGKVVSDSWLVNAKYLSEVKP